MEESEIKEDIADKDRSSARNTEQSQGAEQTQGANQVADRSEIVADRSVGRGADRRKGNSVLPEQTKNIGPYLTDRIANWLVTNRTICLLIAFVALVASWIPSQRLAMDWSIDRMFPEGDPLVASYHRLERRFGGNEIVLAVYRDPNLWHESGEGLQRLAEISDRLAATQGVKAVLSLAELHRILETLQGPFDLLKLGNSQPPLLDADNRLAQSLANVFEGYTHRRGSSVVAIACLLDPLEGNRRNHEQTIGLLRGVLGQLPAPASDGLVAGEPVMVTDGFKIVEQDGWRLGIFSAVLLGVVLLICFRSIRWTLIPMAVVYWTVIVTRAVLSAARLELTLVSSMLSAIVTVIGVATSMHLLLKYQHLRRQGIERREAIERAMSALIVPIAWACATDAVGFLALRAADVGPVRDFGAMMAIGSMFVLAAIVLLVPGLALIGSWDRDPRVPPYDFLLRVGLRAVLRKTLEHRQLGIVLLVVLSILGVWGSLLITVETDFTKNFRANSELVRSYQAIETELGGAGVWDVMLPAPEKISSEYLAQVRELERRLRDIRVEPDLALTKVLSIADAVEASNEAPWLSALPVAARLEGIRRAMPAFSQALLTSAPDREGFRWLRIMLRSREQAPAESKSELIRAVEHEVAEFTGEGEWRALFPSRNPPEADITGYHVMLGRLISSVLSDQWLCFLLATVGIFVTMCVATRSVLLALAALVPNALAIFLVLGAMGWLGFRVNMGAAMIAAVSMGLSIDSAIHYILHLQRANREGQNISKAYRSAQENVGIALVLATAALIAGFLSLCSSQFIPTIVFGVLVALTMLGGLVGNLVVLPLLIAPRSARASRVPSGN